MSLSPKELALEVAKSIYQEALWSNTPDYENPEEWRDDHVTDAQLKRIQSRRCGSDFSHRCPELLYKCLLVTVCGAATSKAIRAKGTASNMIMVLSYCDQDILTQWSNFIKKLSQGERWENLFES